MAIEDVMSMLQVGEELATEGRIRVPARHNPKLAAVIDRVNADPEVRALWKAANVNAVDRLGLNDHGWVHVQIVANSGLRLLRLLMAAGVEPGVVRHHGLARDDAEVVVVLGGLLHDVGIGVHRDDHEEYSVVAAQPKLRDLLEGLYEPEPRVIITMETLHAIVSHNRQTPALSVEAGVVKVADALDMARGRSRIPFESGRVNIHSLSAAAIDQVRIGPGETKPVKIVIEMANSAGIFQVDELLKAKIKTSGLADYLEVEALIQAETETKLVPSFKL